MRRERDAKATWRHLPSADKAFNVYCVGLGFRVTCIHGKHREWWLRGFRFPGVGVVSHPKAHGESYDD
jgi:hypothetical protein